MVNIGIVGLAKSGRATVFNALTKSKVQPEGVVSHTRTVKVPEPRLKMLADILHSKRVVLAEVTYHDVGASAKDLVREKGLSGQFLTQLSNVAALTNVVRAFTDESLPHIEGSVDVERDITTIDLELTFSDLATTDSGQYWGRPATSGDILRS